MSTSPIPEGAGSLVQRAVVGLGLAAHLAALWVLDTHALALLTMIPLAIVAADFLSGLVHWAFDHHISVEHPWLGRFAVDFLDHHQHPHRTLRVGFVPSAFRSTLFVAAPLLGIALCLGDRPYTTAFLLGLAIVSIFAPQFHKLAHTPRPGRAIRALQRAGLILSARAHRRHHIRPHNRAYCIATGWCNPLLDRIGFWAGLDSTVARVRWWTGLATR